MGGCGVGMVVGGGGMIVGSGDIVVGGGELVVIGGEMAVCGVRSGCQDSDGARRCGVAKYK